MIRRSGFIGAVIAFLAGCSRHSATASARGGMMQGGMMQGGMMQGGMMQGGMMNVSQHDGQTYMRMFDHHQEITRSLHELPNGVRTITESNNLEIAELLKEHVPAMYEHLSNGQEVRCMSDSLPTLFRNASRYHRQLTLTPKGVEVIETSNDPEVIAALRRHAAEVTGFVRQGMPAMMRGMM